MIEQPRHHDVAAFVQTNGRRAPPAATRRRQTAQPRPGGVDQDARGCDVAAAPHLKHQLPGRAAFCADAARARADHGPALGGIKGIEHDQTGIIGPAIGIFEAASRGTLERRAERIMREIDGASGGQRVASAEMVIDEQAQAQHPGGPHARLRRQQEAHRPDQVRCHAEHHLAFGQRLAHQAEPSLLEIAQSTMDELRRRR